VLTILNNATAWLISLHTRTIERQAIVVAKAVPDATDVNERLFARVESLENRLQLIEQRNSKLERLVDRLATSYERLRKQVRRACRVWRRGGQPPAALLDELEATPGIAELRTDPLNGI